MRNGDFPERSCASIRLVPRGRNSSDLSMSGGDERRIGLGLYSEMHSLTAMVCIVLRDCDMESGVGVSGFGSIRIVFPLQSSKIVSFFCLRFLSGLFRSWRGCVGS